MRIFALGMGSAMISICSACCVAASAVVTAIQIPEYPLPGKVPRYPSGLLFEVCTDGTVYRAYGEGSLGHSEKGIMDKSRLETFRTNLEKEWIAPLRAECKARGIVVDAASIRIDVVSGEFECSRYGEGEALKEFESKIWSLELQGLERVEPRIQGSCK
jgi:hypothetical protein